MPTLLIASLALAAAASAGAQTRQSTLPVIASVAGQDGEVLVLPLSDSGVDGTVASGDVAFEFSTEQGVYAVSALYDGRRYATHVDADGSPVRVAFDRASRRFRTVSSMLRVQFDDDGELNEAVRHLGAVASKSYPHLGFALVRLSRTADPLAAMQRLNGRPGIANVRLLFQDPARLPRHAKPRQRIPASTQSSPGRPADKFDAKADLIVIYDGIRPDTANAATSHISVLNWGAVATRPTTLAWTLLRQGPGATYELVISSAEVVPRLAPKTSYSASIPLSLAELTPGTTYVASATVARQTEEREGWEYNNSDYAGFTLDAAGLMQRTCAESGRGGVPGHFDPLFAEQWHLRNTGQAAYAATGGIAGEDLGLGTILGDGPNGAGIRVAVADTGLETCHPDLALAVEQDASFNFNVGTGDSVLNPADAGDPFNHHPVGDHGTSVAGLIAAAADNGIGGRGVAPGVLLRGYNMLGALDYDLGVFVDALGGSRYAPDSSDVDVFNLSFGSLGYPANISADEERLFAYGVRRLRHGRGAVYVKAAGNGFNACGALHRPLNDSIGCVSANADGTNNLPYVIVVGGLDANGNSASYSSAGANLWISAPAGEYGVDSPAMLTTDQMGVHAGYPVLWLDGVASDTVANPHGDYTSGFNGTSSAAPNVSGVTALLLEANPELTWRQVKHILASTARQVDAASGQVTGEFGSASRVVQDGWITNAAGYRFHNWYGFGAVDASAALIAATRVRTPATLGRFRSTGWFASADAPVDIPDNDGNGISSGLTVAGLPQLANVEAVVVEVDLAHPFPNDIGIELISPSGTPSILNPVFNEALALDTEGALLRWRLLSNAFYGEAPHGDWHLAVFDGAENDIGALNGWRLRVYYGEHTAVTRH